MPCSIVLLSPSKAKGGNYSTLSRIMSHLQSQGHTCQLWGVGEAGTAGGITQGLKKLQQVDVLIGIHAFRTGRVLKDCTVPYILILGGTDVNEFYRDDHHMTVMTEAVMRARCVVSFSESLQRKAQDLWDHQGIVDGNNRFLFLLVGAIRPVKNPLYLIRCFSEWHQTFPKVLLLIVGPVSDEEYYKKEFQPALEKSAGAVTHIRGLTFEEVHSAMTHSFALVNSSESEGMSLAILEAMQLKVPVLARNIPGNQAIVEDGRTGVLFSSPEEFREKASQLMADAAYRSKLIEEAATHVIRHHSAEQEEASYLDLLHCCLHQSREG
ncbi:hypothetical protein ACOMHN_018125 [Nucella lapillus]